MVKRELGSPYRLLQAYGSARGEKGLLQSTKNAAQTKRSLKTRGPEREKAKVSMKDFIYVE